MPVQKRKRTWLIGLLVLGVVAGACGGNGDGNATSDPSSQTGAVSGQDLSGTINISGSSTVAPISTRVKERFNDEEAPDVAINVDGPGTGDGFALFCDGETDISNASRAIKKAEADKCAANGVEFIELKVGIDGLAVMTHPGNSAVECLSFADLYALVGPEAQGFKNWRDAQALAKELGSTAKYPAGSLDISGPGEESGTYDSFVELALADIAGDRAEAGKITEDEAGTTRPDYQSSGDDNTIVQGVIGSKTSLGWVGFAYAEEQGDKVRTLAISEEPGGECVPPTADTISKGEYPLSRYLYIYVNADKVKENPALGAYVDYYLNDGISSVTEVKYVPLAEADLAATKAVWTARTVGTRDGGK